MKHNKPERARISSEDIETQIQEFFSKGGKIEELPILSNEERMERLKQLRKENKLLSPEEIN